MTSLPDRAWALLTGALRTYAADPEAVALLRRYLDGFEEPLSICVTGPPGAGKTTLVDALRHRYRPDQGVRFVEDGEGDARLHLAPHLPQVIRSSPYGTIVVLSRADEIGGGGVDGLGSARIIARRYQRDPAVWPSCQAVVAVSGLVGLAGQTLNESGYAALASLAARSRTELEDHLLSVDRFLGPRFPVRLDTGVRTALVDQLGLAGVRLAVTLVRTGCPAGPELGAQLVARSGLADLVEAVGTLLLSRAEVIKAHTALAALQSLLRRQPRAEARPLAAGLDRALANAHELRELRLLAALRAGRTELPARLRDEALRLIGGSGTSIPARLGTPADIWAAACGAARRWRAEADDRSGRQDRRYAATVVVRSCEAILTDLVDDASPGT
jgi:hypothetical protein